MTAARDAVPRSADHRHRVAPAVVRSQHAPTLPGHRTALTRGGKSTASTTETSVRAAPQREPEFDDAADGNPAYGRRTLADQASGSAAPADPAGQSVDPAALSRPALRLVGAQDMLPLSVSLGPPSPHRLFGSQLADFAARPSGRGELPDPLRFSRTFVQALLEVLSARRPVGQLAGHTSPGLQAGLTRDQARGVRIDRSGRTPVLHSLRISEPADGVSEWCAVVRTGGRYRALAGRLEGLDGRWRCTRLQIG